MISEVLIPINLLRVSQCLNRPEAEVEAIYKEAVEKLPKEPDFDCVMGDWYWRKGQYEKSGTDV